MEKESKKGVKKGVEKGGSGRRECGERELKRGVEKGSRTKGVQKEVEKGSGKRMRIEVGAIEITAWHPMFRSRQFSSSGISFRV